MSKSTDHAVGVHFTKMHGIGNDYIYIDCSDRMPDRPDILAREMSDRHVGVGGDGIILICPSEVADYKMRIFNSDGSEARMCGNGSRCVGKFIFDRKMIDRPWLTLETLGGIKKIGLTIGNDGLATGATVDMGEPMFSGAQLPSGINPGAEIKIDGHTLTAVSMGNPHGVIFLDSMPTDDIVGTAGPLLEHNPIWPERANIEFAYVENPSDIHVRVWERGSGETMACGTGACATLAAGVMRGIMSNEATIHLPGGDLTIRWNRDGDNHIYMTGPAEEVFQGIYLRR